MNRQQIARIYDEFPPEQQDMTREQFINKMAGLLDPNRMARQVDAMVQRKRWGGKNKREIDRAMKGGPV